MKTLLAFFCVLAFGTAYGKFHSHSKRAHHPLATRAAESHSCNLTCHTQTTVNANSSWDLEIANSDNTLLISIAYNVDVNLLAFIHHTQKLAVAIDGTTGFLAWFNLTSGGVLIINVKSGTGLFLTDTTVSDLSSGETIDVTTAITVFAKIISDHKNDNFNLRISEAVTAIYGDSDSDISSYFGDSYDAFIAEFGGWITFVRNNVKSGVLQTQYGIVGFIYPVFDQAESIGIAVIRLFAALYTTTDGKFTSSFAFIIYESISVSSSTDLENLLVTITNSVQAIGTVYVDLDAAITAYNSGEVISSYEQRTLTIGNVQYVLTFVRYSSGNWAIYIKSTNVNIIIAYYKSSNAFLLYNVNQHIAVVVSGQYSLIAVWNVQTGEGVIVRYTGVSLVIAARQDIVTAFSGGSYSSGALLIISQIESNQSFTLTTQNTFSIVVLFAAMQTTSIETATVTYNSQVREILIRSFKSYFTIAARYSFLAVIGVIVGVTDGVSGLNQGLAAFFLAIATRLGGSFSYELSISFFGAFEDNCSSIGGGNFLGSLVSSIHGSNNATGASGSSGSSSSGGDFESGGNGSNSSSSGGGFGSNGNSSGSLSSGGGFGSSGNGSGSSSSEGGFEIGGNGNGGSNGSNGWHLGSNNGLGWGANRGERKNKLTRKP